MKYKTALIILLALSWITSMCTLYAFDMRITYSPLEYFVIAGAMINIVSTASIISVYIATKED